MDITEIRRENLRRWIEKHGTPVKERSLFSQLKADGSFGEKVARRLEDQYRMGAGYLDQDLDAGSEEGQLKSVVAANDGVADEMLRWAAETIEVYRLAGAADRQRIDYAISEARQRISAADKTKPRAR